MSLSKLQQTLKADLHEAAQFLHQWRGEWQTLRSLVACCLRRPVVTLTVLTAVTATGWAVSAGSSPAHESAATRAESKAAVSAPPHPTPTPASAHSPRPFALTFDDGPHPVHTPALLDWLKEQGIHATFFVLGSNAQRYPDLVKRMVAEGHEVGNHTWAHPNLRVMSTTRMLREIQRTHDVITQITGRAPALFRPPYGALGTAQKKRIEKEFGYKVVLWTVDTLDWKLRTPDAVASILQANTTTRSIVLAHDIHGQILPALKQTLPQWQIAGLRPAPAGLVLSAPVTSQPVAAVR